MARFYPMQRVRYVGTGNIKRLRPDGRPLTKCGDEGTFMKYTEIAGIEVCAVRMDSGVGLGCDECELEPILPEGLEPPEDVAELWESEPELVTVETRH